MRRQIKYFTHEGFNYFVQDFKQHPEMNTLWIDKRGEIIIEVVEFEEDWIGIIIKDIKNSKSKNNAGYRLVNTRYGTKLVHRLVAETWIKKPNGKYEVNHIDHNKDNNSYENLEWVTRSENMRDAWDNGCISKPHFTCRYSKKNGLLFTKDGEVQKMTYPEYLVWRSQHRLPVYASMRKKVIK